MLVICNCEMNRNELKNKAEAPTNPQKVEFQNVKICSQCSNLSTKPIFCLSPKPQTRRSPPTFWFTPSTSLSFPPHTHSHDLPLTKFTYTHTHNLLSLFPYIQHTHTHVHTLFSLSPSVYAAHTNTHVNVRQDQSVLSALPVLTHP